MKLEYLESGSPDCPLIRLLDFTSQEANQLHDHISRLATGAVTCFELHEMSCIESVNGCRLRCSTSWRDKGINVTSVPHQFECEFTSTTWDNIVGLIEPFTKKGSTGYQWLSNTTGIRLLFSQSGQW